MAKLTIYKNGTESAVRCEVEKWEFHDKAMGEQYVTFTLKSPVPVPFEVGDWCEFRGQKYTLNVEPSCTQKARPNTYGEAFTYESVKMNSPQDDLTRCIILDVIPTSGEHSAAYGTNYTGSANFTLNCFETVFAYQGSTIYYAPVHALLDRIKANLDRLYPDDHWQIYIDDSKCHSDDKIITFSNWTAAQALAEVHNTFKLDFTVRDHNIIVGDVSSLTLPSSLTGVNGYVTDIDNDAPLFFGYGKGYIKPHEGSTPAVQGKSLFQIKKVSKNDQQVITRLRAVGSTKNIPYRYYNTHYNLPQTMFVQNLQLPDTFVPYDENEDLPENVNATYYKVTGNAVRDVVYGLTDGVPNVRHVLGKSNDAYIDKNDDAASCPEGIREAVARWDGSDGELPEIYPTIEEATYGELRANNVPDLGGVTGENAYPNYGATERIDEVLGIGDDCNIGNGVMTESEAFGMTQSTAPVNCSEREIPVVEGATNTQVFDDVFTITTAQESGDYVLSYTTQEPQAFVVLEPAQYGGSSYKVSATVSITVRIIQVPLDGSSQSEISRFTKTGSFVCTSGTYGRSASSEYSLILPDFHNTEEEWSTPSLTVTKTSIIKAQVVIALSNVTTEGPGVTFSYFKYKMGIRGSNLTDNVEPYVIWQPSSSALYYMSTPFHLMLKDLGMDLKSAASLDGGDIILSMKSGQCAGREFVVKTSAIERWPNSPSALDKEGWKLELERVNDDSIHAYFPSENNKILPGDQFVLLNIALPDAYIKAAESRLLVAATNHLADNCETKYTYQPSVDDLYLQRNIDRHADDPQNSVFWKLYAGMKFPFYGIPHSESDDLPIADITIESVTIKMGEKSTPQVDITLNDKLEQSTIQRLQTTVDRLYGSVFSLGGVTYASSSAVSDAAIYRYGSKYFLSKTAADTAAGRITFADGIDVNSVAAIVQAYIGGTIGSSTFESGMNGTGWQINSDGNSMELDDLVVRKTMKVFELLVQQVRSTGGEIIVSPANGRIKEVVEQEGAGTSGFPVSFPVGFPQTQGDCYVCTIENGIDGSTRSFGNMFREGDLVRCQRWNEQLQSMHYYWVMVSKVVGDDIYLPKSQFDGVTPMTGDELVLMGNVSDTNRQGVISITATDDGKPRITVLNGINSPSLEGCVRLVVGDLNGISDGSFGNLEGYGLYSDNVYLKGKLAIADGTSYTEIGAGFINLRDGVSGAGIDIENGTIELRADKTTFKDSQGNEMAVISDDGIQSSSVQCVDSDGNLRTVIDINGTRMYYPLQSGQTEQQVMKEEIFLYDTTSGSVSGTETRYYDINGNLLWRVGSRGEFEKGDITIYWTVEQGYFVGTHSTSDNSESVVKGWVGLASSSQTYNQGDTAVYTYSANRNITSSPFNTTSTLTNCFLSKYSNADTGSSYHSMDGYYAYGDASEESPSNPDNADWLTGWVMRPLNASTNNSGKYIRVFRHYDSGAPALALVRGTGGDSDAEYTKEITFVFDPNTGTSSVTYKVEQKGGLPITQ